MAKDLEATPVRPAGAPGGGGEAQAHETWDPPRPLVPDALAERADTLARRLESEGSEPPLSSREEAWDLLDVAARSELRRRIAAAGPDAVAEWSDRILRLVDLSHLTFGTLFSRRAARCGSKILIEAPRGAGSAPLSWRQMAARVEALARGLAALCPPGDSPRVAILSTNRLEMAVSDLACLSAGLVNVIIPGNSTEADAAYILQHSGARIAIVSDREQLGKVLPNRSSLPRLERIFVMDREAARGREAVFLDELSARSHETSPEAIAARLNALRSADLASVMYTSGTTGKPKGIRFTHRSIVFKRFARALALPEIGPEDIFLCYLPLFHTFGRFLELFGCIFWEATYCFQEDPSAEALVRGMRRFRPSVFISVPKKWMQLHEEIARAADLETAPEEEVAVAVRSVTGGRLRWGLSAAGYLDPDIFRFFQRHGIELMSGFGMTEATGGITMTPPGRYRDDTLGCALPGIEIALAADGELLIRGPYVTDGILDPPAGEEAFDADGWLRTGDLMERDADGFIRLIDRKKEIYKNVKGETIAPQRIEPLFREFESVGRVFLVGDHREYNTALIWPNPRCASIDLARLSTDELAAHFRSIVVSVNTFLAPYERIVDFALIDRDLDAERGELTAKGTIRRKAVEANFTATIRLLYRRTTLTLGGVAVMLPNWLFQVLGLTSQDLRVSNNEIALPPEYAPLRVARLGEGVTRVGDCVYTHPSGEPLPLGLLLTTPRLWLGNDELFNFAPLDARHRHRAGRAADHIGMEERAAPALLGPDDRELLRWALERSTHDLTDLHLAALAFASLDDAAAFDAVRLLEKVLSGEEGPLSELARVLLRQASGSHSQSVRRGAFLALVPVESETRFRGTLSRFLDSPGLFLDHVTRGLLCDLDLTASQLEAFMHEAAAGCAPEAADRALERRSGALLGFLGAYGAAHPARFRQIRAFLVRTMLFGGRPEARQAAGGALAEMEDGFRTWLGPVARIAVDPETGREYRREEVLAFDVSVPEADRRRILAAVRGNPVFREAIFLLFGGTTLRLGDVPPGGVSVRRLAERHGRTTYRVTIQTRLQGVFELALCLSHGRSAEAVREEMRWLILCGASGGRPALAPELGGHWQEQDLRTEELVAGDTLDQALRRLSRKGSDEERLRVVWPFLAWSAIAGHLDFWDRTGRRWEIADPSPENVVVPTHDYHTGARLLSVASVRPHEGVAAMLGRLHESLVERVEREFPLLRGGVGGDVALSALIETAGVVQGTALLRGMLASGTAPEPLREDMRGVLDAVEARGFVPMRLHFAIQRFHRWAQLAPGATPRAQAATLQEFADTYGLQGLSRSWPEARARFFRETVFRDAEGPLAEGLDEIIGRLRRRELDAEGLRDVIADLRARIALSVEEDFFLTRLSYPHLRPEDTAGFVQTERAGRRRSEMVVTLEDSEGNSFQVRHALNPKEVGRLHRLFITERLDVQFRPEHRYLVAISDRGQILGGIYYDPDDEARSAHLEKIVVAERFRRKGVADGLMKEFFSRMRDAGFPTVSTGFFRPDYFAAYGFVVDRRLGGLVKPL